MKRCSEDINQFVFQMFAFGKHWSLVKAYASFTKKVNWRLAKRPLKTSGHLANRQLTSLVKEACGGVYLHDLVQRFLPGAICNQRDHAGLICADQKQPKIYMKWGQRNLSKNVNNMRPFSTCFRLLNTQCSPKSILNPLS